MRLRLSLHAITLVALWSGAAPLLAVDNAPPTYRGGTVTPPLPKPRFTLSDTSGASFDFWTQTNGYVTLLFFGYAHCVDVCPTHMAQLAAALKKLPLAFSDRIKVVFVTTDPARDDLKSLRTWLNRFDQRFIGLSGSERAISAAQIAANLPLAKKAVPSAVDGEIEHSAFVLAYSKDNLAHVIYPPGITEEDWIHDLTRLDTDVWR